MLRPKYHTGWNSGQNCATNAKKGTVIIIYFKMGLDTVHDMHVKYMSVPRSSSDVAYNICPMKYQMHMDGQ